MIGRNIKYVAAAAAFVVSLATPDAAPAIAAGAVAVGVPPNVAKQGFAYGRNIDSPSEAQARQRALTLCRNAITSTDEARQRCTVVMSFHRKCVAMAMDPMNGTPGIGWAVAEGLKAAEDQAMVNCRATAGPARQGFCKVSDSACDERGG